MIWVYKTVLKQPGLLHSDFDRRVIGGPVYLRSSFAKANQDVLDLQVGIRAIIDRRELQELGKEEWVFTYSLNRLEGTQSAAAISSQT